MSDKGKKTTKTAKKSFEFGSKDKTLCIICGEMFDEDWIQCSSCKGWAHENCTSLEGKSLYYVCDVCGKV